MALETTEVLAKQEASLDIWGDAEVLAVAAVAAKNRLQGQKKWSNVSRPWSRWRNG